MNLSFFNFSVLFLFWQVVGALMAVTGKMQHQKQSLILVSFDNDFFFSSIRFISALTGELRTLKLVKSFDGN